MSTRRAPALLRLFEDRRSANPGAPALLDDHATWTYAQLDTRAAAHADELRQQGVGREDVVGIVAERSAAYVAMVLGVLRAGAAFVPLEVGTPPRRTGQMCAAAEVRTLLVDPTHQAEADRLVEHLVPARDDRPAVPATVRDPLGLAYVIFTSGSTGVPKGAMVADGGMDNHILAKTLDFQLGPEDVVGFNAPLSFDISVWQALTALTVGGSVCVASPANLSEPAELAAWAQRHGVTVLELVPSFLAVLLDELEDSEDLRRSLRSLRLLVATGEALPAALARRWYASCPDIGLMNAYGPTECSDDVTHHVVTAAECATKAWPSIGREIVHTTIHVLDPDGDEVAPGGEGELAVGGRCVGRGYIGDPARTALAFVPDHLSGDPGARLYRTGDHGRRAPDGTLDYLGRRDRQVKVRGHRVELGDVEAELLRVPSVAQAACVLAEGRLHAFVTLRSGADGVDGKQVLETLRAAAPRYLVPHEVAVLDHMPTGATGKVDHKALAGSLLGRTPLPSGSSPPTLGEVCAVVAEVLEVAAIGPDDDFFALGGDSLSAMSVMAVARKRFDAAGASLPAFLADPTPHRLLAVLEEARRAPPPTESLAGAGEGGLSSGQERLWFVEQLHTNKGPQLLRLELRLRGPLDERALQHAMDAVVARHEPLRTAFSHRRGVPVATVFPPVPVRIEQIGATEDPEAAEFPDGSTLTARKPEPPLMAVRLRELGPDDHLLTLLLHHLVADGLSLGILGDEVSTFYQRRLDGDTEVPALDRTFMDYVRDEREWFASPAAAECQRYWIDQLEGASTALDLPMGRPYPDKPDFASTTVSCPLTVEETDGVVALARALKATPFMAVTTAAYVAFRALAGVDDLVLGIDAANRSWTGSDQLIGTFVNQLPLRLAPPAAAATFADLLAMVRRQCLGAYTHDRLPFHKIVAAVNPPRQAGRFPLFQVKVTQQGAWRSSLRLPGIEVEPSEIAEAFTDLDLLVDVSEEAGRLRLDLVHRPELLDSRAAETWVAAIAGVLAAGVADPHAAVER